MKTVLSRQETAYTLGLSLAMADKLIARGQLTPTRIGRRVVFQQQHIREFLESSVSVPDQDRAEIGATVAAAIEAAAGGDLDKMGELLAESRYHPSLLATEAVLLYAEMIRRSSAPATRLTELRQRVRRDGVQT